MEPSAKCVHGTKPCVARDWLYSTVSKMNHECQKVGLRDLDGRRRLRLLEGVPRGLIPVARFRRDVVNVCAFPQELIEELIEGDGDALRRDGLLMVRRRACPAEAHVCVALVSCPS